MLTDLSALPSLRDTIVGDWHRSPAPSGAEAWHSSAEASLGFGLDRDSLGHYLDTLADWRWPQQTVHFVSDTHADARALVESLALAGLVRQTGPKVRQFALTEFGLRERIIVGGDCLDKGPSNLKLLDVIRQLQNLGADVVLLAGNHDLRLPLGLRCFSAPRDVFNEHLFVRMGRKTMPLLVEIWKRRLKGLKKPLREVPDKATCRAMLLPGEDWPERFRQAAADQIPTEALEREINRIGEKVDEFPGTYKDSGLGIRQVYAAAREAHRLFIEPAGEYAWFLSSLRLMHREACFLFLHAGVDDPTAQLLANTHCDHINREYRSAFDRDPFGFYAGSLGNTLRTKYRPVDYPLTDIGTSALHGIGIRAIVHGHRSHRQGQRLALRSGLLHVEADVTLDRNTRRREGFQHPGAGIVTLHKDGFILGISADHPRAKVFSPGLVRHANEAH